MSETMKERIAELIARLPEEARPIGKDTAEFFAARGEEWLNDWTDLVIDQQFAKAHKMMLKAMTPTEIEQEQLASRPFLVKLAWSNNADMLERKRIVKEAFVLGMRILIAAAFA